MAISNVLDNIPAELGLQKLSENVGKVLDENPLVNKIIVVANFIFRTAMMVCFMAAMPFSILPNFLISFGLSVFYRVTIERFCQYRFSILSCAAAGGYEIAKPALTALISGAAFTSLAAFGSTLILMTPFVICGAAIISVTNQNVNERYQKSHPTAKNTLINCCQKSQAEQHHKQKEKSCCPGTV